MVLGYIEGVPILLRQLIFNRISLMLTPVFYFANRLMAGLAAAFLLFFYPANTACAEQAASIKPLVVAVVQGESSEHYLEFTSALQGNILKRNIVLIVVDDLAKPLPDADLVISVGIKAATAVAASNAPVVLNVLIPKAGYEKLRHDFSARANSKFFSAIFLDQPVARQVRLIAAILPDRHRVGVLFDSFPQDELVHLRQQVSKYGLSLHEREVSPALPLYDALREVLQESEVLLALPDSSIYNSSTLRNILLTTYRSNVPLVGFSPSYVKAGALCAVFSTPVQIAAQAAMAIQQLWETSALPAAQYPPLFEVMVNEQVAHSLGLNIKSATELHNEMSVLPRRAP